MKSMWIWWQEKKSITPGVLELIGFACTRKLCSKLFLKAEAQVIDRVLEVFARRYWSCNPDSLFGSSGMFKPKAKGLKQKSAWSKANIYMLQMSSMLWYIRCCF